MVTSVATVATAAPRSGLFGLSRAGVVSLTAVLAVVVAVSLPRLHGLARRENQVDARATAELFARALARLAPEARALPFEELARQARLTRTLRDAEWLEDGRVLRLHGYLFELCPAPATLIPVEGKLELTQGPQLTSDCLAVRAWPWSTSTGLMAFVVAEDGPVFAHANEDGHWQGLEHRPEVTRNALEDWQRLP
jgi:hypothetical protein